VQAKIGTTLGERLCWLRWALAAPSTPASTAAAKNLAMAFTLKLLSSATIFLATNLQAIQRLEKIQLGNWQAHLETVAFIRIPSSLYIAKATFLAFQEILIFRSFL
jgi:hypothetical protein